jgi:D-alanyl-lipoteichoic acid acyltransferase DltB (MBOAT superfamily)
MKEKVILVFVLVCLSIFGFRSFLPAISLSTLIGLFTVLGLIGCAYLLWHSKSERRIGYRWTEETR